MIKRAGKILEKIEKHKNISFYKKDNANSQLPLNLDGSKNESIIEKIKKLDITATTPLYALNFLNELKKEIEG